MRSHPFVIAVRTLGPVILGAALLGAGPPGVGDKHVICRVVTSWSSNCDGSTRSDWDDMVNAWYAEITNDEGRPDGHGNRAWDQAGFQRNGNIVDSDFTDPAVVDWGHDDNVSRLDRADAYMVGFHGGETGDAGAGEVIRWRGTVRVNEAGDGNCKTWQGSMRLGNWDLEFFHISSCHSMCSDSPFAWEDSMANVHQISGFHGIMYIIPWWPELYADFGDDGFDMSLGDAWLDQLYDPEHWYELWQDGDQCPVAMASGADLVDAWDRLQNEQYNNVYDDPTPNNSVRIWVGDCNPDDDPALP